MDIDIFDYVTKEEYEICKTTLKDGENKVIFETEKIKITLTKRGKKVYTFIDEFGTKKLNYALNEMSKLI